MAAADAAAAAAAAGEMVNASTSAKAAADINDKHLRWLSEPARSIIILRGGDIFSHGGHVISMAAMEVWGAD